MLDTPLPQIEALFALLEKWFVAIEDGTVTTWLPDPTYKVPYGWPKLTERRVNEYIEELDREMDMDALGYQGQKYKADASCEFNRLAYPQRLALTQAVQQVIHETMEES